MIPQKIREALNYPIPRHSLRLGYMLGGLSLGVFAILFLSGATLAWFGYSPSVENAHAGMLDIESSPILSTVRSIHSISSELFLVLLLLHLTRIVLSKSYHGDRQMTWNVGIILLVIAVKFSFTGTILKWDQEAYEAFSHLLWANSSVPFGGTINEILFSGDIVKRFFVAHVVILPALFFLVIGAHLALVKVLGISPLNPSFSNTDKSANFMQHIRHAAGYFAVLAGAIIVASAFYEPPLLDAPFEGVEWTKPPWPFLFLYTLENMAGIWALLLVPPVLAIWLFALPFLSKPTNRPDVAQAIYFAGLLLLILLILYGALSEPVQHMM